VRRRKSGSNSLQITTHLMHLYLIIVKTDISTDGNTYSYVNFKMVCHNWMNFTKKCYLVQPFNNL